MSTNPFRFFHFRPGTGVGGFTAAWVEGRGGRLHIGYAFRSRKDAFNRKLGCRIARGRLIRGLHEGCDIRRGYVMRYKGDVPVVRVIFQGILELLATRCPVHVAPRMNAKLIAAVRQELCEKTKGEAE